MSHQTRRRHRRRRRGGRLLRLAVFAALATVVLRRLRDSGMHEHFAAAHDGHGMPHHYE